MNDRRNTHRLPLHRQIAAMLRREIIGPDRVGQRLESEAALGRRFGVSSLTIREALSALAAAGLVERRHGSGTYITTLAACPPVAILCDMALAMPRTSNYFLCQIQGLRQTLRDAGYRPRLYLGEQPVGEPTDPLLNCYEYIEDLELGRLHGTALVAGSGDQNIRDLSAELKVPLVGVGSTFKYGLLGNQTQLLPQAVKFLASHGRLKIAAIGADAEHIPAILASQGLPVRADWMYTDMHPADAGAGWERFRSLWTRNTDRPNGLIVTDDVLFRDVAIAVQELAVRVPDQLRIVTHSNATDPINVPFPISRMETDAYADAAALAGQLITLMRGKTPETPHLIVSPQWIPETAATPGKQRKATRQPSPK